MISKLALIAAVVAANEIEEEQELHNHFVAKKYTRAYKFGTGWCGHKGAYTDYADVNKDGRADQMCSDHQGRHWIRYAHGNGSFFYSNFLQKLNGYCKGSNHWVKFADLTGDGAVEMICSKPYGQRWALVSSYGTWSKINLKKISRGWCGDPRAYTQFVDINGDGKADMTCSEPNGKHWIAYSRGNGTFYYKYQPDLYKWCSHKGSWITWADINGDGKKDITCNDTQGRHWSRLSRGYSWGPSVYHGANWCKGGITRYSNFWYDSAHKKAEDMICDYQKDHYIRPSLGNGHFHSKTWKTLTNWCHMDYTHYADVNGNGVDDVICSWKGNHWLLAH